MEDLNDIAILLGNFIGLVTRTNSEPLLPSTSLSLLPRFLSAFDPDHFSHFCQSLITWPELHKVVENYFAERSPDFAQKIDFEDFMVSSSQLGPHIDFWLQIISAISLLEIEKFAKFISSLETVDASILRKLLNEVSQDPSDCPQIVNPTNKSPESGFSEFKRVCRLLEQKQQRLDRQTTELSQLKSELDNAKSEQNRLAGLLLAAKNTIIDIKFSREEQEIQLIESQFGNQNTFLNERIRQKSLLGKSGENLALNEIVFECQKTLSDQESEIRQLQTLRPLLAKKQLELDEAIQQVSHYQNFSASATLEKEIAESKLRALESLYKSTHKFKERLETREEDYRNLQQENADLAFRANSLERLLKNAKENLNILSRSSVSSIDNPSSTIYQYNYIRDIESENCALRQKVAELRAKSSEESGINIEEDVRLSLETAKLAMKRQPNGSDKTRTFQETRNSSISPQDARKSKATTLAYFEDNLELMLKSKEQSQKELKSKLQKDMRSSITWFNIEELPGKLAKNLETIPDRSEIQPETDLLDLLYTTLMEFHHFELSKERMLAIESADRRRDILKPFSLNAFLQYSVI